ncbi:MAG TPA: hypothetical protein VHU84_00330 [Lacipirellulaceae bacterium]|nr:hypothetical protein [Lacipirellulaceae bacterium]
MSKQHVHRALVAIAIGTTGAIFGASVSTTNVAHGEVRGTPEPPAFQTGDQISVPILREISATLRQMDGRLARLETVAQRLQVAAARHIEATDPPTDSN